MSPVQGRSIACALRVGDIAADILRHDMASGESVYVSSHHAWTMSAPRTVPATENHISLSTKPLGDGTHHVIVNHISKYTAGLACYDSADDTSDDNADGSSRRADCGPQLRAVGRAGPAGGPVATPLTPARVIFSPSPMFGWLMVSDW